MFVRTVMVFKLDDLGTRRSWNWTALQKWMVVTVRLWRLWTNSLMILKKAIDSQKIEFWNFEFIIRILIKNEVIWLSKFSIPYSSWMTNLAIYSKFMFWEFSHRTQYFIFERPPSFVTVQFLDRSVRDFMIVNNMILRLTWISSPPMILPWNAGCSWWSWSVPRIQKLNQFPIIWTGWSGVYWSLTCIISR